jgi:hypothetical protein
MRYSTTIISRPTIESGTGVPHSKACGADNGIIGLRGDYPLQKAFLCRTREARLVLRNQPISSAEERS